MHKNNKWNAAILNIHAFFTYVERLRDARPPLN